MISLPDVIADVATRSADATGYFAAVFASSAWQAGDRRSSTTTSCWLFFGITLRGLIAFFMSPGAEAGRRQGGRTSSTCLERC